VACLREIDAWSAGAAADAELPGFSAILLVSRWLMARRSKESASSN
jgi:hypothetical protein